MMTLADGCFEAEVMCGSIDRDPHGPRMVGSLEKLTEDPLI